MTSADTLAHMAQMLDAVYEHASFNHLANLGLLLMVGTVIWLAVMASTFARKARDLAELQVARSRELAEAVVEQSRQRVELINRRLDELTAELDALGARLGVVMPPKT